MSKSLYTELVDVTTDYLGPAADRFMARHIETHLHITPSEITSDKIPELTNWLGLSMALLISDAKIVSDFNMKIKDLGK